MKKPRCPFCGRKLQVVEEKGEGHEGLWSAYCHRCVMDAGHFESKRLLLDTFSGKLVKPKPCPLCGREPELMEDRGAGATWYTIRCRHCLMDVGQFKTERRAIAAWNRRAVR